MPGELNASRIVKLYFAVDGRKAPARRKGRRREKGGGKSRGRAVNASSTLVKFPALKLRGLMSTGLELRNKPGAASGGA